MPDTRIHSYADAMQQTTKEAKATVAALAAIIVVWLIAGFGLSSLDVWVFHTPLWVICGCILPWIAAVIAALVLGYKVFVDFDLDEVAAGDAPKQADESLNPKQTDSAANNSQAGKGGAAHE